ncbi:hypothetical protein UlMin_020737 [Ulmus minor]
MAGVFSARRRSEDIDEIADMVFGFLEVGDGVDVDSPGNSSSSGDDYEDGDEEQPFNATLCRTSSLESKIRQATKEALRNSNSNCLCGRQAIGGCWSCLRREICNRLVNLGYDCAICKSKWRSTPSIPSGEHSYLEVVDKSNLKRGVMRVVIELNFRAEFEMARASEDYNKLISRLPEVLVGKTERLRPLIKILCTAAKKCMKEKNMHFPPWRKHKYMQSKWLGTCERSSPVPLPVGYSDRPTKAKASMLTFDLLDAMAPAGFRRTAAVA